MSTLRLAFTILMGLSTLPMMGCEDVLNNRIAKNNRTAKNIEAREHARRERELINEACRALNLQEPAG